MSNDPLTIHIDKVAELLRGLGLDPVEVRDLKSVHMDSDGIKVVRFRKDAEGHMHLAGDEVSTETVTIGVRYDR